MPLSPGRLPQKVVFNFNDGQDNSLSQKSEQKDFRDRDLMMLDQSEGEIPKPQTFQSNQKVPTTESSSPSKRSNRPISFSIPQEKVFSNNGGSSISFKQSAVGESSTQSKGKMLSSGAFNSPNQQIIKNVRSLNNLHYQKKSNLMSPPQN